MHSGHKGESLCDLLLMLWLPCAPNCHTDWGPVYTPLATLWHAHHVVVQAVSYPKVTGSISQINEVCLNERTCEWVYYTNLILCIKQSIPLNQTSYHYHVPQLSMHHQWSVAILWMEQETHYKPDSGKQWLSEVTHSSPLVHTNSCAGQLLNLFHCLACIQSSNL